MKRRVFLAGWIPPVIATVTLPAHAQTSTLDFLEYDFTVSNRMCNDASDPSTASFTICNNEFDTAIIETVNVIIIGRPDVSSAVTVSPTLPFTIPGGGGCIDISIQSTGNPPFQCGVDQLEMVGTRTTGPRVGVFGFVIQ